MVRIKPFTGFIVAYIALEKNIYQHCVLKTDYIIISETENMSQEDKRKARSIAKGLFTRAKNTLTHCIDSGDDSDIIVRKLDDLDRRYASLVEKHQLYIYQK